jgi:hypothetical protein
MAPSFWCVHSDIASLSQRDQIGFDNPAVAFNFSWFIRGRREFCPLLTVGEPAWYPLPGRRNLANFTASCSGDRSVFATDHGGLAQLGERLHGMQEVIGSSPLSSTS